MTNKLLTALSKPQKQAVTHNEGPIQLIAVPGSGKTRVITHRTAYLINEYGIPPESILAVTFTKKAAEEMEVRLKDLISSQSLDDLNIGTFHSACFKILRNEIDWFDPRMLGFDIVDGWRQVRIIMDVVDKDLKAAPLFPAELLKCISRAKNDLLTPDIFEANPELFTSQLGSKKMPVEWFIRAYRCYEERKRSQGLYDFDDLLLEVHRMLRDNAGIRAAYSNMLDYFLVDEFHDTNKAQFEILQLLCESDGNIMVVADDDQSVYSWRGAIPAYTIEFKNYFPTTKVIRMEKNYRSCTKIIDLANKVIHHNVDRLKKASKPNRKGAGKVVYTACLSEGDEARFIAKEIPELRDKQGMKSIAVLYRTNAQSRALEDALVHAGISYTIVGSQGFYNRKEVKDIIAYLRVVEFEDDEALQRIINTPSRYLGKAFLGELAVIAEQYGCSLLKAIDEGAGTFSKPYMARQSRDFARLIWALKDQRKELSPGELVERVRDMTEYDSYINSKEVEDNPDNNRIQNLDELASAAAGFETLRDFLTYAESMQAKGSADGDTNGEASRVELLTLHRAKGLEWDVVFLVGVSERMLPHHRAESYEEERRLFYVGITRARDQLYISSLESYQGRAMGASPFLVEAGLVKDKRKVEMDAREM